MSVLILPDQPKYVAWRHRMVAQLKQRGITDKKVLDAMDKLPRHWFVGETLLDHILYDVDQALTIDCGQTISKPYTVAWQTQLLELKPMMTVFEVGTGSGYQTAILCEMKARVYTVERHAPLFRKTKELLAALRYTQAHCFLGDSFNGVPEMKDFMYDRVLVTCGAPEVPEGLMKLLKVGGIMVIPVGNEEQRMLRIFKEGESPAQWRIEDLGYAKFVPMLEGRNF
jgi:protein-L-isoaspartate(D-aspartate) O-methyltransferase